MGSSNYPLLCYFGGELMESQGDIIYRGGEKKFVFVSCRMNFSEVLNKLYEVVGCDPRSVELKVQMKYPVLGSFTAVPLDDDNSLKAMWFAVRQMSAITMQIYIQQVPKQHNVEDNTGSFRAMVGSVPLHMHSTQSSNYPLLCYWGGELMESGSDFMYKGGKKELVLVSYQLNFSEVLSKLYEVVGCDPRSMELKIQMRYPFLGGFRAVPLDDDTSFETMWYAVSKNSDFTMQLYIQQVPKHFAGVDVGGSMRSLMHSTRYSQLMSKHPNVMSGSFKRMLTSDKYVHKHSSDFTSPIPSPYIRMSTVPSSSLNTHSVDPNDVDAFGLDGIGADSDEDEDELLLEMEKT